MYPILLELGPIQIYTYGVFLALAFYFSVRWAVRSGGTLGIPEEKILNLAIVSILSAIVGARFTYVVVYWQKFQGGFLDVFKIWNGGLVFYGGLIGGVLGGVLYWWWKKENVLAMADCAAMAVSLGQGIGRIGCFFYGCCYGLPVVQGHPLAKFGIQFPAQEVIRHPTQVYSSLVNFLIFALLAYFFSKKLKSGLIVVLYCYFYGVFRFLIEIMRDDPRGTILGIESFSTSQTISLLILIYGVGLHFYIVFMRKDSQA